MVNNKNKAFTIVELVVAMALLVMLVGLSSVVFSTTVKAHRKAVATIEITRNLRVLAEQLNADFRGLRKDAPLMIWFDSSITGNVEECFDMTHFFADGDFQTVREYTVRYDSDYNGVLEASDAVRPEIIYANLARIFYGHANAVDLLADPTESPDFDTYQVLSRKSHALTSHGGAIFDFGEIPLITNGGLLDYTPFDTTFGLTTHDIGNPPKTYTDENGLEFNTITLTNWVNALNYLDMPGSVPNNANHFLNKVMFDATAPNGNVSRPFIDLTDFNTLHLLMVQGVMSFSIQWAYTVEDLTSNATTYVPIPATNFNYFASVRWWPDVDPLGDGVGPGVDADNDFGIMGKSQLGAYFELPEQTYNLNLDWYRVRPQDTEIGMQMALNRCQAQAGFFRQDFYPTALKFTFRLKDSNNIFPDGKTFTHIVYLDN